MLNFIRGNTGDEIYQLEAVVSLPREAADVTPAGCDSPRYCCAVRHTTAAVLKLPGWGRRWKWMIPDGDNTTRVLGKTSIHKLCVGRHNMQVDLWPFDLESGVRVPCDVG